MKIGFVDLFLSTALDGTAAPVFPGGATIEGSTPLPVILPAPFDKSVRWTRGAGGANVAQLVGAYGNDPPFNTDRLYAFATSNDGLREAGLIASADDTGNGDVEAFAPGAIATILGNNGISNFVQAAGGLTRTLLNGGFVTLHFAASTSSNFVNVNHGLGADPRSVQLTPINAGIDAMVISPTSSTIFQVHATNPTPLTGDVDVYCLAIS